MDTQYVVVGIAAGGPGMDEPGESYPTRAYGPCSREAAMAYRDSHAWLSARIYPLAAISVAVSG